MKKLYLLFLEFIILFFNPVFAETAVNCIPREIEGIGTVYSYQTGKNTFIGVNFNLELLYIATATGSGFTHPAYCYVKNEFSDGVRAFYQKYTNNTEAINFDKLSLKFTYVPERRFPNQIVAEILSFKQVMDSQRVYRGNRKFASLGPSLRHFYHTTNSHLFFRNNLAKYNEMTKNFASKYSFNYPERLELFFGESKLNDRFEVILSPLYYGGEALTVRNLNQTNTYISIINPLYNRSDWSIDNPAIGNEDWIINALYHETAHNFLIPILLKHKEMIKEYGPYLNIAIADQSGIVTSSHLSFINEILARAITIYMIATYHNQEMAYRNWALEKKRGWRYLDEVYSLIVNKYLSQREKYATFESFFPVVLEYFKAKNLGVVFDFGPNRLLP